MEPSSLMPPPSQPRRTRATWIVVCCLALSFLALAAVIPADGPAPLDEELLRLARRAHGPALTAAVLALTRLGNAAVLIPIVAVCVLWLLRADRGEAVFVLICAAGAGIGNQLLKLGFARPRPSIPAPLLDLDSFSFPSGHAMGTMGFALALGLVAHRRWPRAGRWVRVAVFAIVAAVGASRVYLGVHYPTDVLAGWALGAAWVLLVALGFQRFDSPSPGA